MAKKSKKNKDKKANEAIKKDTDKKKKKGKK